MVVLWGAGLRDGLHSSLSKCAPQAAKATWRHPGEAGLGPGVPYWLRLVRKQMCPHAQGPREVRDTYEGTSRSCPVPVPWTDPSIPASSEGWLPSSPFSLLGFCLSWPRCLPPYCPILQFQTPSLSDSPSWCYSAPHRGRHILHECAGLTR